MKGFCFSLILILIANVGYAAEKKADKSQEEDARTIIPEGKPYKLSEQYQKNKKEVKKRKAGWVEKVCIGGVSFPFSAKLDTGARTSSANAEIIKEFKKNGKPYILYRLVDDEKKSEVFESAVTRYTRIKKRVGEKSMTRPYVVMDIKVGTEIIQEEVNLTDRGRFNYPILIGRNMLSDYFYVDSGKKYSIKTQCDSPAE